MRRPYKTHPRAGAPHTTRLSEDVPAGLKDVRDGGSDLTRGDLGA